MNETVKMMLERRCVRQYTDEMPKKEDLDMIIEAGLWAASGMNVQASKIVAITNKELRDRLMVMNREIGGYAPDSDPFYGAPVILLVLADKSSYNCRYDGSLTMGNMMLAAHALGLGSCWINRARQEFESEEGKQILKELGIEGDWEGIAHCIVGVPAAVPAPKPRKEGRVLWVE